MTKADIISSISKQTGIEKATVQSVVEGFMDSIKSTMVEGDNVYLRGFGSFVLKKRAQKVARNIAKNTIVVIPEHNAPAFKPSKAFSAQVKETATK